MIPIKGKKYMINCQGPYDYNRYMGEGICTGGICPGGVDGYDDEEVVYGFRIPNDDRVVFFLEQEIVGEFDNGLIKEPEQIESSKKPIDGKELTSLIPIDNDWKMQMIEETAEYLVSPKIKIRYKEDRMGAFAGIAAIHIVELIAIHMHKNGYEIIKTK